MYNIRYPGMCIYTIDRACNICANYSVPKWSIVLKNQCFSYVLNFKVDRYRKYRFFVKMIDFKIIVRSSYRFQSFEIPENSRINLFTSYRWSCDLRVFLLTNFFLNLLDILYELRKLLDNFIKEICGSSSSFIFVIFQKLKWLSKIKYLFYRSKS